MIKENASLNMKFTFKLVTCSGSERQEMRLTEEWVLASVNTDIGHVLRDEGSRRNVSEYFNC